MPALARLVRLPVARAPEAVAHPQRGTHAVLGAVLGAPHGRAHLVNVVVVVALELGVTLVGAKHGRARAGAGGDVTAPVGPAVVGAPRGCLGAVEALPSRLALARDGRWNKDSQDFGLCLMALVLVILINQGNKRACSREREKGLGMIAHLGRTSRGRCSSSCTACVCICVCVCVCVCVRM